MGCGASSGGNPEVVRAARGLASIVKAGDHAALRAGLRAARDGRLYSYLSPAAKRASNRDRYDENDDDDDDGRGVKEEEDGDLRGGDSLVNEVVTCTFDDPASAASGGVAVRTTLLHVAVKHNRRRCLVELCRSSPNVDVRNPLGFTPLHLAAIVGAAPATVTLLLAARAEVDARDDDENTPLHLASRGLFGWIVAALIAAGAERTTLNAYQETPLQMAAASHAQRERRTSLQRKAGSSSSHLRRTASSMGRPLPLAAHLSDRNSDDSDNGDEAAEALVREQGTFEFVSALLECRGEGRPYSVGAVVPLD